MDLAIRVIQWLDTGEDGEVWQCAVVGRDTEGSESHLSFLTMLLSYSITCSSASEQRAKVKRNFQGPIAYSVRGQ